MKIVMLKRWYNFLAGISKFWGTKQKFYLKIHSDFCSSVSQNDFIGPDDHYIVTPQVCNGTALLLHGVETVENIAPKGTFGSNKKKVTGGENYKTTSFIICTPLHTLL